MSIFFLVKLKTAYEVRIIDWRSDVCSSDMHAVVGEPGGDPFPDEALGVAVGGGDRRAAGLAVDGEIAGLEPAQGRLAGPAGDVAGEGEARPVEHRKSVVSGQSVSVRGDLGGRHNLKQQTTSLHDNHK